MNPSFIAIFCLLIASFVLSSTGGASLNITGEAETRTWTSNTGSKFVGHVKRVDGDRVVLTNSARREVALSRDQLSPADRAHLREFERQRHAAILEFFRAGEFDLPKLPEKIDIHGVRHVSQRENFCVPASAEMLLRFHGYDYDQDYLARLSSRDSARSGGTNFGHLRQALENLGIDSVILGRRASQSGQDPTANLMNGIRAALAQGRPVIISYENLSTGHAVLAVGYDDRRRAFWVMDPALGKRAERLDYRVMERLITGAFIAFPRPLPDTAASVAEGSPERNEFLSNVSRLVQTARPDDLPALANRLREEGISAHAREANRGDLRTSQGQTRSFARDEGVGFIRLALERGLIVAAPQNFEEGAGMVLIYGTDGRDFRAVEYRPGGAVRRGNVRSLDLSLRWIWRVDRQFLLPLVEIEPPVQGVVSK